VSLLAIYPFIVDENIVLIYVRSMLRHFRLVWVWCDLGTLMAEIEAVVVSRNYTCRVKVSVKFFLASMTAFTEDEPDYECNDS
jgi:hypothetical protein